MPYKLVFKVSALKEWKKLGRTVQLQFKKKLAERLENPHLPSAALAGATHLYKIKLHQAGYHLLYSVENQMVTVTVIAIGKHNRNEVYDVALARLKPES